MSGALTVDPADQLADDAAPAIADPPAPEPTLVPDPIATYPAGLDPRTLCPVGEPCERPHTAVLRAAIAIGSAQLAYAHHPTRTGGRELSARVEVWHGSAWAAHVASTVDWIDERSQAGGSTTAFHDLTLGGRVALAIGPPAWLIGSAHLLDGDTTDGGRAVYGAVGVRVRGFELELAATGMELASDTGLSAGMRAARDWHAFDAWLELDAGATTIGGMPSSHVRGGAGAGLHGSAWSLAIEGWLGDRALAITDHGELAEAVADTFHAGGRALFRVALGAHLESHAGVTARAATTPDGIDYTQVIGFAGLTLSF